MSQKHPSYWRVPVYEGGHPHGQRHRGFAIWYGLPGARGKRVDTGIREMGRPSQVTLGDRVFYDHWDAIAVWQRENLSGAGASR